jgi:hypothetical protein
VERHPDCSTHAEGKTNKSVYYSDSFKCTFCDADIFYSEEKVDADRKYIKITYRKDNYNPTVKVVG